MNPVLDRWNKVDEKTATEEMLACCGSRRWAMEMVAQRPVSSVGALSETADRIWATMNEADWLEAFACHPRIGERQHASASELSSTWSLQEQSAASNASQKVLQDLVEDNRLYEERFGFTYIVCATGKSADEMLQILKRRLLNGRVAELREAAEQQRQIMQIRLGKWLLS